MGYGVIGILKKYVGDRYIMFKKDKRAYRMYAASYSRMHQNPFFFLMADFGFLISKFRRLR